MKILRKIYSLTYDVLERIVNKLLLFAEIFLFLRLMLKFFTASPKALIVALLYEWTDILVSPFEFIFPDIYWSKGYLIDVATLSAMIGYWLAVYLFFQILNLFSRELTLWE